MAEDPKETTPPVEVGTVDKEAIAVVEKEIQAKDNAKLDELNKDYDSKLAAEKAKLRDEFKQTLDAQIEATKKTIEESYSKKFDEVNEKLQDLTPRKGIVQNPGQNPYEQIAQETQAQAQEQVQEITVSDKINYIQNADVIQDKGLADAFLENIKG